MRETDLKEQKLTGYLGLAMRSGQMTLGADQVLRQIRAGQAALVLIDGSASGNTLKKLKDACAYHHVPSAMLREGLLSAACGRQDRAAGCLKPGGIAERVRILFEVPDGPAAEAAASGKSTNSAEDGDNCVFGSNA